jgi:carbonic anhydrase/acetyltransferase-like protein (isoleucine patch superfamily)
MLIARNGNRPNVDSTASVAPTATIVGAVDVGPGCYIDHNVVIESSGPKVVIDRDAIVLAGSVLRSVGGDSRPGYRLVIGSRSLVAPQCTLAGCEIGQNCYVATGVIVLQGATVGDDSRVGIGAIVHAGTQAPRGARIGFRHVAIPDGPQSFLSTPDVEEARSRMASDQFFGLAFATSAESQADLHYEVMSKLLAEVRAWQDSEIS